MEWTMAVKFWLLIILSIPSAICSLLIFAYFYRQRKQRSIHHHMTLLLVFLSFLQVTTDLPFVILYYQHGEVAVTTDSFCLWWNWWDYSTSGLLIFAMAWACVERHLLVFYNAMVSTRRKRILFHHIPIGIVCVYPLIFYLVVIVFNTCENQWDFQTVRLNR
jgi:cytochrome b